MPKFTTEQQEAIDIEGTNILVSAGAGSGKTEVLSQRVLRKIIDGTSIDNLLVLTFTNAAAAEMKDRIRDKIGEIPELKEEFDKVMASYIVTFDAFTLAIVKKYHYLKELSKDINVVDSSIITLKKNAILDNLFEEMYEKEDKNFLDLIKTYCFKNDDDIKNFVRNAQKDIELFYDKKDFLNNFISNFYNENTLNSFKNKYEKIVLSSLNDLSILYNNLYLVSEEYALKTGIDKLLESSNYEEVYNNAIYKLPSLPKNSEEELKFAKETLKACLDTLNGYLKKPFLDDYILDYNSTKDHCDTLIGLITKYDELIDSYKFENNLFEFLDIAKIAIDILRENEDVRLYYKNRFNEILIDEYQDTSDLQEIFISLIEKNNVYMVGDIKQSIYRFRNANPDIFRTKFNNYGKKEGGLRVDLNKNFRSREEVLDNINLIFNFLMDDYIGGADYEKEHKLIFGNLNYQGVGKTSHSNDFEVLTYKVDKESKYKAEEIEIFTMLQDIKEKVSSKYQVFDKNSSALRDITYNDFAILIDKSKNFDLIKKIFNYKNIPIVLIKDESIKDSINIKIIKNLLVMASKINDKIYDKEFAYAFTSISRSYLSKIDDEEIFDVVKNKKYFENELFKKVKKVASGMDEKNIFELINSLYTEFDIYNKVVTIGDVENNFAVLEYILEISKNNSSLYSIPEFINYLDNITYGDLDIKYSFSKSSADSVKVMTIHKSKGLEYPVVYFPFLKDRFNHRDIKTKFTFNKNLGIIMPIKNESFELCFTKEILKNEFLLDDIGEKLRLFYVALTRAREKFIFIMDFENKKDYDLIDGVVNNYDRMKYRSFKDILESVNKVILEYSKKIDIESLDLTKEYDFVRKSNYKESLNKINEKLEVVEVNFSNDEIEEKHFSKTTNELFTNEEKKYINEGLNLHLVMENIDFENFDINEVDDKNKQMVEKFLDTKITDNFINIYKEYEFMYEQDNINMHGIIDLLIEKDNEFIIVDYKLNNITSKDYIKQLKGYKSYIEKISNKKTSIYLYSLIKGELLNLESDI